ncbi:MAG TPA: hypothetical protein VK453_23725 [Micromonosporaceae bacterium]|nr:hypothetical protein [Micromonosporaceae bacterium]
MRARRFTTGGTLPMVGSSIGIGLVALSGYVFIAVVGRLYDRPGALAPTAFYFLVTTVVLGVCLGLEQATNRRTAFALASGADIRRVVLLAIGDGVRLVVVTAALLCAAIPVLVPRTLRGDVGLFVALVAGLVASAAATLVRGMLAGAQRFGAYAVAWCVEGLSRIAMLVGIAFVGHPPAWGLGWIYVLPFGLAAIAGAVALLRGGLRGGRRGAPTATAPPSTAAGTATGSGVAALAAAGVLTFAVANLPQLILTSRDLANAPVVFAFTSTFMLARMVMTAMGPLPSLLLPGMTAAVAAADMGYLRRRLRLFTLGCVGVGLAWAAFITVTGPPLAEVMFAGPPTSRRLFLLLSLGTIALATSFPVQVALIALGRYRWVTVSWVAGVVTIAVIALWPSVTPITAATLASIGGPGAVLLAMALSVRRAMRSPNPPAQSGPAGSGPAGSGPVRSGAAEPGPADRPAAQASPAPRA